MSRRGGGGCLGESRCQVGMRQSSSAPARGWRGGGGGGRAHTWKKADHHARTARPPLGPHILRCSMFSTGPLALSGSLGVTSSPSSLHFGEKQP